MTSKTFGLDGKVCCFIVVYELFANVYNIIFYWKYVHIYRKLIFFEQRGQWVPYRYISKSLRSIQYFITVTAIRKQNKAAAAEARDQNPC